ncbi:type-F conjugative transfer system pilin assembly protein TrbC [Thioalkalivibrio sp. ALMg11]|uniref:type-F conjugative transfer system pilin assembly protein TrbC n=1 Tax=Thioalkalivibrio sp. ALMg11 TaxID=1158165 RepID=UPI00037FCB2C|nr:type-F conjugative transfer system pilin assembly protein TrbC [Thioalkalivibrio sp. ALMg11]
MTSTALTRALVIAGALGIAVPAAVSADVLQQAQDRIGDYQRESSERLQDDRLRETADGSAEERMPDQDRPLPSVSVPDIDPSEVGVEAMGAFLDRMESGEIALPDPAALADGGVRLIAFASFSIPDENLKRLILDVNRAGGVVLMQGLHEDSFEETSKKVRDIVGLSTEFEFDIDPRLFVTLGIERVPTFALVDEPDSILEASCTQGLGVCEQADTEVPALTVSGDVSVRYALETMERRAGHSDWRFAAENYLNALERD